MTPIRAITRPLAMAALHEMRSTAPPRPAAPAVPPDVSVCIVNWNTRDLLYNCLSSIARHTHGARVEVIVVDNASSDGSVEMMRAGFPEVRVVASRVNHGFARGSNLAASLATGDYVLFLNPDTELDTDAITGLWEFLRANPGHGVVGCRLLNSDGSVQTTCAGEMPTMRNELSSLLFLDRLFPRSHWFAARELEWWDHADSRDVDCLSGACMMLPRPLVERLGGFDGRVFMYGEDLDLCCRVRQQGLKVGYLADETIFHHEGAASRKRGRNFAALRQRGANYFFLRKNLGAGAAIGYRAAVAVGAFARLCGALLAAPFWALRRGEGFGSWTEFVRRHGELVLWSLGLKEIPGT
jgi:GT2 family glycosyltransferase